MRSLRLSFSGRPDATDAPLSVDGMAPTGPNLSHWPGNRTPAAFKADLSTGICLCFARAPRADQDAFLGDTEVVLNDHYDTDGFLSLLAIQHPEVAFDHEELCLAAAATGDFQTFVSDRAFAVDRIVTNLARDDSPYAAAFAGLSGADLSLERYRWLLEHAPAILARPDEFAPLYRDALGAMRAELRTARAGALQRRVHPTFGWSIVHTQRPMSRMTLNSLAGAWRVLHVLETEAGLHYRYHDRTESWFELVTLTPPPRLDLRPLAARLQELEGDAAETGARWCADPPTAPIPELYFGLPSEQEYGRVDRQLTPSRLRPEQLEKLFGGFFGESLGEPSPGP